MTVETDQDRLDFIRALGGLDREDVRVRADGGSFDAVFQNQFLEAVDTETSTPVLTCRSSDIARAGISKDDIFVLKDASGAEQERKVKRIEPDGTGMSRVILFRV